jgi:hypothetical protein
MSQTYYTVGKTDDGSTVLRVGDSFTTTLTMEEDAVVSLIKLLAATLDNYTVDIQSSVQLSEDHIKEWIRVNKWGAI